jgi:hypothetical protein
MRSTVPLSSLLPPKDNRRRIFDRALIVELAQSIKADGLLQNLLVCPEGNDSYRVIFGRLGSNGSTAEREHMVGRLIASCGALAPYEALGHLSDEELERLAAMRPLLCFGQEELSALDTSDSLFNRIVADIGTRMRQWWVPDVMFLSGLLREQVVEIASECGASKYLPGYKGWTKKQLAEELARYFAERSDPEKIGPDDDTAAIDWLPGVCRFPATKIVATTPSVA